MKAEYVQTGDNLDYINPTDSIIEAGTIIAFGTRAAVAATRMEPGELGSIATVGVFKVSKDASEIPAGTTVYYDDATDTATVTETSIIMGYSIAEAAADNTEVIVKLNG